jgi:hypothetical protein
MKISTIGEAVVVDVVVGAIVVLVDVVGAIVVLVVLVVVVVFAQAVLQFVELPNVVIIIAAPADALVKFLYTYPGILSGL